MQQKMWSEFSNENVPFPGIITSVAFSTNSQNFAIGLSTGWLFVYQINPFQFLRKKPIFSCAINCIVWSKDGRFLVMCSDDSKLCLVRSSTLKIIREYFGSLDTLYSCDITQYNDRIIAGGRDTMIHLWSTSTPQHLEFVSAHREVLTSVHFSSDGQFILTSALDGLCRIFQTNGLVLLRTYFTEGASATFSVFCPSEKYFFDSTSDNVLKLIGIHQNRVFTSYNGHIDAKLRSSVFVRDRGPNVEAIVPSDDGSIKCYNALDGNILWDIDLGEAPGLMISVSPDSEFIVATKKQKFTVYKRNE